LQVFFIISIRLAANAPPPAAVSLFTKRYQKTCQMHKFSQINQIRKPNPLPTDRILLAERIGEQEHA
jgi:hypothetical protein